VPTWGEVLTELHNSMAATGQVDFDGIRRKYIRELAQLTGRDVIIYYSDWLQDGPSTSITLEDMQGLMEVCKDLHGTGLDLLLHTPGGSPEATHRLVGYLQSKFTNIRVFVPLAAMSAGTMWALSADEIVMGKHSQLGPIDPQVWTGSRFAPARAIIGQFEKAKREIADKPETLPAWFPMLQQYGPSLLEECENAEKLSVKLVSDWLAKGMLKTPAPGMPSAEEVATYFANHGEHLSHALGIDRESARSRGLNITDLEDDPALQDAVLSVHHATMHTFGGPAVKIVENHLGRAFVKMNQQMMMPQMMQFPRP